MDAGDVIKIEGPPSDAEKAKEILESQANELVTKMDFVEIDVDVKYHKHIIGKGGSTGKFLLIFTYFLKQKNVSHCTIEIIKGFLLGI